MDVTAAIADPVRREILGTLRQGPQAAGAIAAGHPISRPAISRHLRVLRMSGLVTEERDPADGRGRIYRLDPGPLLELDAWLAQFRPGLTQALDALTTEVHRARRDRRRSTAAAKGGSTTASITASTTARSTA